MGWIDRVENIGGKLTPMGLDAKGNRTVVSLLECKRYLGGLDITPSRLRIDELYLEQLRPADPTEYTRAMGINSTLSGHMVYQGQVCGVRVVIPAVIIIATIVGLLKQFSDDLFCAASLARIAAPRIRPSEKIYIHFRNTKQVRAKQRCAGSVVNRFAWLTCFPSGVRFWDSVYQAALEGHLGLRLPNASVKICIVGLRSGDNLYATRMDIESLTPTESPFPFADKHIHNVYLFRRNDANRRRLKALNTQGKAKPGEDIPMVDGGWATSTQEWCEVVREVAALGLKACPVAKPHIDAALQRLAKGCVWKDVTTHPARTAAVLYDWKRSGKWEVVKRVVQASRLSAHEGNAGGACAHSAKSLLKAS